MEQGTFYITTPIYYPSQRLHIGHAYCTTAADTMARFKRMQGYDVMFLTGTDEHGQKIERVAKEAGTSPQEYVDQIVSDILDLWKLMNISHDDFIRTTQPRHIASVQKMFKKLSDNGDLYKDEYEGWYCTPCESFWLERQLVDGLCPDCGRPVELSKEESYFFRTSKYADRLIQYIRDNPDFIQPESRKNEMLQNFLLPGLEDLCVSRTSLKWGIPVDFDPGHTVYVWLDALSNYITALGYLGTDDTKLQRYWPADVQLVGKEIMRFHTIIWPIMLMALELPLPKKVFGHGWLVFDGEKMSKSRGNVVDPYQLCERYGVDAVRYFLMRNIVFGADGNYTQEALLRRINSDLANDLGNLLSRAVAMTIQYRGGITPQNPRALNDCDREMESLGKTLREDVAKAMDTLAFQDALATVWQYVSALNKYIDLTTPWKLGKSQQPEERQQLDSVLYHLAEGIRLVGILIEPVMPNTPAKIFDQLGIPKEYTTYDSAIFGVYPGSCSVKKGEPLFPRIDVEKELASTAEPEPEIISEPQPEVMEEISYEEFMTMKLRTAKVLDCQPVEKTDRLLQFTLDVGGEVRTIISGIRKFYQPEELIGKTVIIVANLKPTKIRGIVSQGMILSAADDSDEHLSVLTTLGDMESGVVVR